MRYPNTDSMLFCEQVSTVTSIFEKWNDCERTVIMYALLKRLRYPSLKFLQYSIDHNLAQNLGSQFNLNTGLIDINANSPSYLKNLLNAYKAFTPSENVTSLSSSDKESIYYGSDISQSSNFYNKKEEILNDILVLLPLLKPGNDDAKILYLSLIPISVNDTEKQIVSVELVQQIFSYLLIHPAITSQDRKSLSVWLRKLEDNIKTSYTTDSEQQSFYVLSSQNQDLASKPTVHFTSSSNTASATTTSSLSVSSLSSILIPNSTSVTISSSGNPCASSWQTIAPPQQSVHKNHNQTQQQLIVIPTLMSTDNLLQRHHHQLHHDWPSITGVGGGIGGSGGGGVGSSLQNISEKLCDNLNGIELNELAPSQNSLGLNFTGNDASTGCIGSDSNQMHMNSSTVVGSGCNFGNIDITNTNTNLGNDNNDDHHISFSKNGTEIPDFEASSSDNCNGNQLTFASILDNYDQFDMNRWSLDSHLASLKTRRSNSLTTATISSSSSSSNSSVVTVNGNCSNSSENLAQYAQKPRSFSLSIEHHRGSLTSSGSDTRLDDFKPNYLKFTSSNVGMSNIGQWLKSLRLHKYIDLFKDMTYEEMLEITEDYLQSLGVTKGASHKLALCIDKLKDRFNVLTKIEQDLLTGQMKVLSAVEDLTNIVLTPMKSIELVGSGEENIALKFVKILDLVCSVIQKDTLSIQDDESITVVLWILERSIHNESFTSHINQLKEQKFKLSKLKMSIAPKTHPLKNNSNGNLCKPRWNGKTRKGDSKNGSNDRINRKNSNDMLNFSMLQQTHQQPQQFSVCNETEQFHHIPDSSQSLPNGSSTQYKSSSYPNFVNSSGQQQSQIKQQPTSQKSLHQQMQHVQHHHHTSTHMLSTLPQHHQMTPPNTHHHHQPQQQQQQAQLSQHRHSLTNVILVPGGAQQLQQMLFQPGQAILSATTGSPIISPMENNNSDSNNNKRKVSLTGTGTGSAGNTGVISVSQSRPSNSIIEPLDSHSINTAVIVSSTVADIADVTSNNQNCSSNSNQINSLTNSSKNSNTNSSSSSNTGSKSGNKFNSNSNISCGSQLLSVASAALCSTSLLSNNNININYISNYDNVNPNYIISPSPSSNLNSIANSICNSGNNVSSTKEIYRRSSVSNINAINDIKSLEQLEFLCLQMTEQAIN